MNILPTELTKIINMYKFDIILNEKYKKVLKQLKSIKKYEYTGEDTFGKFHSFSFFINKKNVFKGIKLDDDETTICKECGNYLISMGDICYYGPCCKCQI